MTNNLVDPSKPMQFDKIRDVNNAVYLVTQEVYQPKGMIIREGKPETEFRAAIPPKVLKQGRYIKKTTFVPLSKDYTLLKKQKEHAEGLAFTPDDRGDEVIAQDDIEIKSEV